nr:MAG TPA: hypothetical protein [Caudoviricetes sp.]
MNFGSVCRETSRPSFLWYIPLNTFDSQKKLLQCRRRKRI